MMKITARIPLALVIAAGAATPGLAQQPASTDFPPAISVSGEASVSAPPDLAQIDAGVTSDAKTAREAAEANNTAMAKVLQALKAAGIEDKDYQTSRLSLQPQYAPNRPGQSTVVGYRASNRVTIKLHDVSKVASLIDTVVGAGANDVGNVYFTVAEPSKLLDQAREKAVADARRKAEIYAKAAGVTLGAPLSISEEGTPTPMFRVKTLAAPMAAASTPVAQGEETLSIAVSVTWAIKTGQ
ncbi:SIMPL domain-containing protein [Bradyrhizobium sp. SZCCHNPS10061]|uniref:SIMPL domain-containing protein n=1 Tax=Bradyrhizobium sp. SZCCHNPS10061 TaxID=3057331 RepID=UPI002916CF2B|nr:SIMPL domain-containing protein [Bradyrhizobium sp. SZCCHNPS10061]